MKIRVMFEDLPGEEEFLPEVIETTKTSDLLVCQARLYFEKNKENAMRINNNQPVNGNWEVLDWSDGYQKTEFQLKMHNMLLELGM